MNKDRESCNDAIEKFDQTVAELRDQITVFKHTPGFQWNYIEINSEINISFAVKFYLYNKDNTICISKKINVKSVNCSGSIKSLII